MGFWRARAAPGGVSPPHTDDKGQDRRRISQFRFRHGVVMGFLALAAVMSGLFNYQGIITFNEAVGNLSVVAHGMAVLLALTVGIALFIAWFLALSIHPESLGGALRRQGHGLIVLTALFALAVSTSLNLMGVAGGASTVLTLEGHVQALTRQSDAAFEAGAATQAYLTALSAQNRDLCDVAERELSVGGLTRSGGPGVVSASYRSACQQTAATLDALEAAVTNQTARQQVIRAGIESLAAAIDDPQASVRQRVKAYRRHAGMLRDVIREGRTAGMGRTVDLSVQPLQSLVPPEEALARYSPAQRAALEGLRHRLEGFVALMREAAAEDAGVDLEALRIPEPPTPLRAVFAQAHQTFPFIGVAIGVDLASLWFAAWLGINRAQLRALTPNSGGHHA